MKIALERFGNAWSTLGRWAGVLKQQALVVYFAARDPRTPPLARWLALMVAAYALSPIDLIPDFIPVLGYLDDLLIVPLGVLLVLRMLPTEVREAAQRRARTVAEKPVSRGAAAAIVAVWILVAAALAFWAWRWMQPGRRH